MNNLVNEWVEKAEEDFRAALTLHRSRRYPTHNAVCFHAQQCIEKYLKAILEKHGIIIRKIHALAILLDQCAAIHPLLSGMRSDMVRLSEYAVEFRYPGESATVNDGAEAMSIMLKSRVELRMALGLEDGGKSVKPLRQKKTRHLTAT
jgi:HEPN domain-containing protein